MDFGDFFRTLGGLAGMAALLWRGYDEFGSYLRISIKVEGPKSGWVTVLSTVDNKGTRRKNLTWAFLLIGPEDESPVKTANLLLQSSGSFASISYTNDLFGLMESVGNSVVRCGSRVLMPLPFFYSENIAVGDETLSYKSPVYVGDFPASSPFSVRLFVSDRRRLHRSTHDCFIVDTAPT
jgi:hypothetical protein